LLSIGVETGYYKGDTMTKKHFIALADSIRWWNRDSTEPFTEAQIAHLADFCKAQNGQFNRSRWLGYIAGENGKNGGRVKDEGKRPFKRPQQDANYLERW